MFTRCPACETTFRLGAGDLRRAQGRVRCGECSTVFNALEYLAEDPEELAPGGDAWLPEPANDPALPDDSSTALLPVADDVTPDFGIDDGDLDEDDDSGTAIFVTDPDDDGFYYGARRTGSDARQQTEPAAQPDDRYSPDDLQDSAVANKTEPELPFFEETQDEADAPMPLDIYSAFDDEEHISAVRWNEALQQHEQAETGLDLTASVRIDYLSPDELDDDADDMTVEQPALAAGPDEAAANPEDDFDDTIWERIPGVGSLNELPGRPIDFGGREEQKLAGIGAANPLPSDQVDEADEADDADDDSDLLEFNAPEDTWSNIFVRGPSTVADDDDDAYPELRAETTNPEEIEPEERAPREPYFAESDTDEADTDDFDEDESDDTNARLERLFRPEEIAARLQARTAAFRVTTGEQTAGTGAATGGDSEANPAAQAIDIAERRRIVADWLTEEEEAGTEQEDEFPAEGYDVQHIILPDESEAAEATPAAGRATRASTDTTAPLAWQQDEENPPARSRLWLVGGLLLLAALAAQLVHYNRDSLAASPLWGNTITRVYTLLGLELFPAWRMNDYEIRSAEAVAGESGPDIMDIRAQIAAVGKAPTGLPYLRAVLSDRWSKPVAEKIFTPADYADASGDRLLQPGQSIEVHVSIVDPGAGAQGFELELCLPRRHTGMECTGQPFK